MSEFLKQFVDATGPVSRYSDENYEAKDQPGYISAALENVKGGLENVVGGFADFAGVHLNALDQAGRESSLVESIRNSDGGPLKSAGNLLTGIGSYLGDDADQTAQKYGSRQEYGGFWDRATNPSYYTDPRGLTADAAQGVGSMIPFAVAATVAPEVGGARIATGGARLLRGLGFDGAAEKVGSTAAQKALSEAAQWGTYNGPMEAISNAGGIYDDLKKQGYSDAQAAQQMRNMAIAELPWDAITEATSGAILSGKLAGSVFGDNAGLVKRSIQNLGINTPVGMTSEYVNEMKQQQIQNEYSNQPYGTFFNPTPDEQAAGGMGAMGALIPGVFGAARGIRNKGTQEGAVGQSIQDTAPQDTQSNPNQAPQVSMDDIQSIIDNANAATNNTSQQAQSAPKGYNVTDEVSDTGLATGTEQKLNALSTAFEQQFGEPLNITSMKRHGDGTSWHDSGQAFDAAGGVLESSPEARQWLMNNGPKYGLVGLNEYDNPSENATGGHIHFSDHGDDNAEVSAENKGFDIANKEGGNVAGMISQKTGLPAEWVWAQMYNETGGFSSDLAKEDHNYAGVKNNDGSYRHFDSDEDFADYQARNLEAYREDGLFDAKNVDEYAAALKHGGYFTDDLKTYQNGMKSAINGEGSSKRGNSTTNNSLSSGDDDLFSNKIIDFADYMRNTSTDPETINFFEDKFNNKDKFIDTPENRQAIEQNYSDQFKKYMDQRQDQQLDLVNKDNMDNIINANQPQQIPTHVVPKPNSLPSPVQIETKTPNLDKTKQNQKIPINKWDTAVTSQKLNIIADRVLQGDQVAQKAINIIPQKYRDILMEAAINRAQGIQKTQQQSKVIPAIKNIDNQQKGANINENSKTTSTETSQGINPENQSTNSVSGQSNEAAQAEVIKPKEPWQMTRDEWNKDHVQRFEEPGINEHVSADKPQGLYTTPAEYESPHADLGGKQYFWTKNKDANVLNVGDTYPVKSNRKSNPMEVGTGVYAAIKFIGKNNVEKMMKTPKKELASILEKKYHDVSWEKYYDQQEMVEAVGAIEARKNGYNAISSTDAKAPEFSEYVALDNKAITPTKSHKEIIKNALNEGKSIPDNVIKNYPDLKEKKVQNKFQLENKEMTQNESRFGDETEAQDDLLKTFGIKKKAFKVIDDSDEALEAARKEFTNEMNNISANPMFNPKLMTAAFKVGMIHLQRGMNQFADWAKAMTATSPQLKPFLESVWDSINAYPKNIKFDENKMSAVMRYVGTQYDNGITDKDELKQKLVKMIGKDYAELIEPAYAGVVKYPTKEAIANELNDSTKENAERNIAGNNSDTMGENDAGEGSRSGRGQSLQPPKESGGKEPSGSSIHGRSSDISGTVSNSAVRTGESGNTNSSTGTKQLSGGIVSNFERSPLLDDGRVGRNIKPSENGRVNAANLKDKKEQKKNNNKFKAGDPENIRNDLPMLLPEQIDDVSFAEKRLLGHESTGVLFTNGTGTGKTFTGLGIAKRFAEQGKDNILIITPSTKINSDWVDTAKGSFDLEVTPLEDTKDAGKGVVVTTYANMGSNNELVQRKWDLIIPDESHTLMSGENGKSTAALDNFRAITLNSRGFYERFQRMHEKEYQHLNEISMQMKDESDQSKKDKMEIEYRDAHNNLDEQRKVDFEKWATIVDKDKPKVVFLSATPWAYVQNIDYAEGYLFKYPKADGSAYNSGDGKERFYMSNFGYRMRYNKLTRPEGSVNSAVMEVQFHKNLRNEGALSGRALTVDKDYDRGFILVNGGVGKKIDEGFEWLSKRENGMSDLADYLRENYKGNQKDYLLEAVKAKEAIPLINKYLQSGKKVVVFHGYKKGGAKHPFRLSSVPDDLQREYTAFVKMRPDLLNLDLRSLHSPLVTLQQAYGDKILIFNGDVSKKNRELAVKQFNDDNSGKNLILVQQDAGQAGISLHDRTGKHQRVLINLGMPTKPVAAIQIEGRIYRVGQQSNAIFRYLNTGTLMEKMAFATKIAERASTAENLALGEQARDLKNSFVDAFEETMDSNEWKKHLPGMKGEGLGGKEKDRSIREAPTAFDKAKTYYYAQQKKNARTRSAEGKDYFATPEPLGYKMVEWANLKQGDSVLEPSAGHGAIARFFPGYTKNIAIEPSSNLAPRLKMAMDGGEVINTTFENYYVGNKFNAIVMNPPFGTGGKTAVEHVAKAFKQLKDGGRLVAIVPDGPSSNKYLEKWLYGNDDAKNKADRNAETDAFLMKTISLPSVSFERAGTKISTKVIIIDKQETKVGKETAAQYQSGQYDVKADNINELFDNIENITVPSYEVRAEEKPAAEYPTSGEKSNFETGTHKNTNTGEEQAKATFKDRVSKDSYASVNSVAKRNGGYYSRFAKGFLFKDETNRENFVKEANALLASNVKSSAQSTIERMRSNIKMLADSDLNGREKALQGIGKKMGVPVVFFEGHSNLHGFFSNGISFLNRKSATPISWTFWHESFHWMKDSNPSLYNDLVEHMKGREDFSTKQLNEYRDEIGRPELSDEETIEEMLADYMPDVARRVEMFKSIGQKDQSLAARFMAWISDMMDKFNEFLKTPAAGLTNAQKILMKEKLAKLAGNMTTNDGEKIFTVNGRTGEIKTKRDGNPISDLLVNNTSVSYSTESKQNSDEHGENKNEASISENIQHGLQAMDKVISNYVDVEHAMYRDDVGNISFYWGTPGKGPKLKHGYGISHLIARRDSEDGSGIKTARKMVDVIANGTIKRKYGPEGAERIDIGYDGHTAVLSLYKDGNQENWLLSGWKDHENTKKEVSSANGEGYGSTEATTSKPMRTRQGGVDTSFINNSISQEGHIVQLDKNEKSSTESEKNAYSTSLDDTKYSAQDNEIAKQDKSYIDSAANKLAIRIGIKKTSTQIKIEEKPRSINEIGSIDKLIGSPSNIAQRVPAFKMFYEWATRGMNKLTKLRSDFNRKYGAAMDLVKTKDDKASLYELLLQGDTESKEWSKQELLDDGVKENVAEAYTRVRRIMNKAYRILNDARRRPQVKSETLSQGKLDQLKENKFVEINKVDDQGDDKFLVTYKEFANWKKNYTVNSDELKRMKKDDAIQILKEENAGLDDDNKPLYNIETREGVADLNKLKGYVPHFFHEFFVMQKDTEGGYSIVDSGKTVKDAVGKAEAFLKENPNAQLVVRPKQFDFSQVGINKNDEMRYAVTVGDREYKRVTQKLAKDNDISLTEAREMMQGKLKMKNRHRFYGNFIQRKGASGYEKDLDWVMRHFFNTSSRYVAMETEFKPKSISLFERLYGRFDDEHSDNATARYIKDYINDINGNPTGVELWINDLLNNSKWWRNHVVSNFGDRAALQLASSVTNTISVMKLGCMNISSAMINFSQLINSAALIGDTNVLWKAMQKGAQRKYSKSDLKVLVESGVMNDIGLDSGSGYGKMSVGDLASKSMFFFKHSEGIVRRGTILAAYEQALKRGIQHDKAIEYAQQVNRKANFDYGVNDAPNIFRRGSIISQIMLQFKKYPIKEFELMAEMLSNQTSKKQKVIFWGSYFLLAGLMQVPAIDWFDDILQSAFGSSYKNKIKQAIFTAAGDNPVMKTLAKTAVYGLFSLANVDVSSRTGVGDAIPKLSKPSDWFGPTSSTIIQTFMYAKDGDTMQALKMLSPGIANMVMAIIGKNEGSRGRTTAVYDSMYDRALRLLGFKSVDESIATDKQSIIYDENKAMQKEKQQAVDAFIEKPTSENASRLKELGVKKKTVDDERKRKAEDKESRIKGSMSKKQQKEQDDLLTF